MTRIAAVIASSRSAGHAEMAAEALKQTARTMGHTIAMETPASTQEGLSLSEQTIREADVVILATDERVDTGRFAGKPVYATRTSEAIRHTKDVIETALSLAGTGVRGGGDGAARIYPLNGGAPATEGRSDAQAGVSQGAGVPRQQAPAQPVQHVTEGGSRAPSPSMRDVTDSPSSTPPKEQTTGTSGNKRLVGITSCPTGIAHTFMAAEALQKAARSLGHTIKVETQGSVGAKNQLTDEDIANADAVIIAADTKVDTSRFAGKPIYMTGTKQAMQKGQDVVRTALEQPVATAEGATANGGDGSAAGGGYADSVARAKADRSAQRTGPYKHLMTGVSYMLPLVVAGGLSIALAFAFGGINAEGTLAQAFSQIGGTAFGVFVAVLSAFIAYSIADRPGIAPGLVGGLLATALDAGFLGGILSGFLAGYVTKFMADYISLPATLQGLMPVLILPFFGTVIVGLLMIFIVGPPVATALASLTNWLEGLQGANAALLGLILGAMMAFDMGGPVNKAAYGFAVGLLASNVNAPMAAVMAAGMTPPLGLALASWLFKSRFDEEEREAAPAAGVMGLAFITEGAIPFAAKDPLRVIPSLMLGSATAAALSMFFNIALRAPHGGIFVTFIPQAVSNWLMYIVAILAGTLVTTAALFLLKRHPTSELAEGATRPAPEEGQLVTRA